MRDDAAVGLFKTQRGHGRLLILEGAYGALNERNFNFLLSHGFTLESLRSICRVLQQFRTAYSSPASR